MAVELDEAINHFIGLLKGGGLVVVDAFRLENREKVLCHSVVITIRECPKKRYCGKIIRMKKIKEEAWKQCPKCGKTASQVRAGYNKSGSVRCKCKECGIYYTIEPKRHAYPDKTRKLAIKMYYAGVSGRGVGNLKSDPQNRGKQWNWTSYTGFWSESPAQKPVKMCIS